MAFLLENEGAAPNNARLPLLIYPQAVPLDKAADCADAFEDLFSQNGWGRSWRNGIYDFVHFHSSVHEVLGIARGRVRIRFGGAAGFEVNLRLGDVAVLPAGTGHQRLSATNDLLVVGAYPPDGVYDECRGTPEERAHARWSIPNTPLPDSDPAYGSRGPLMALWRP